MDASDRLRGIAKVGSIVSLSRVLKTETYNTNYASDLGFEFLFSSWSEAVAVPEPQLVTISDSNNNETIVEI
jgi:phosphoheptose isomerase